MFLITFICYMNHSKGKWKNGPNYRMSDASFSSLADSQGHSYQKILVLVCTMCAVH